MELLKLLMKHVYPVIVLFFLFPSIGTAKVWDFTCTEAVSLLKAAQERVVRKHDQLQEAKFSLRHSPMEFDGCKRSRRGFDGGKIHCVKHQSRNGHLLKDILVAQQGLDASIRQFNREVQTFLRSCPHTQP